MASSNGPNSVKDGLRLIFDAANIKSFRGEPTTNVVASDFDVTFESLAVGNTAGFSNQLNDNNYVGVSSTIGYTGSKSLQVNRGSGGSNFGRIYRQFSVTAGEYSTFSAWVYSIVSGPYLTIEYFGGDYTWNVAQANNTHTGSGWERLWVSTTVAATSNTTGYYFYYPSVANTGTYIDDIQVEKKSYYSPFINGTRGATVATGGGFTDLSGNSNNGELFNVPKSSTESSGVVIFNGSTQTVKTTTSFTFGNNYTWEAWVNRTSSVNTYNMFMGRNLPYFGLLNSSEVIFSNLIGGAQQTMYSTGFTTQNNTWYHLVFTTEFSGANTVCRIYINGSLNNSATFSGAQGDYSGYIFQIGDGGLGGSGGAWYPFNGKVGLVRLYNKTLSASEILQNFNANRKRFGI